MNYFSKIKEHWLISTIILGGIVCATIWTLSVNPMVEPRSSEMKNSKNENANLERNIESKPDNEKKSLQEGTSFTSKFGFMVYISGSDNDLKHADIYITLENQKDKNHRNVSIGQKIKINHEDNSYSIEINDIKDNLVDLIIRKNT